ncbi:hypothetical protein [Amphritea sp. HPY]|uniref:hypothetical protein n=1 Tax=Amphritea sp. HPY TaxID=3421652 RepID=UPI003D7C68A2
MQSWLREHWLKIDNLGEEAIRLGYIPNWYLDEPSDKQLAHLRRKGVSVDKHLTKGKASDLIGLLILPTADELEKLRFFKSDNGVETQTQARIILQDLFKDTTNVEKWDNRPASLMDKEFCRFFKIQAPKKISHKDSLKFQKEYISEADDCLVEDWKNYCYMFEDLIEPEFRDSYDLKEVELSVFRKAVKQVGKEEDIDISEMDIDDVIWTILELRPDLQKD